MTQSNLRDSIRYGLLAGVIALSVSIIGMVRTFDERDIITGLFSLGQLMLFAAPVAAGYIAAKRSPAGKPTMATIQGLIAGLFSALPLAVLILVTVVVPNIRSYLVNVSRALIDILTFSQPEVPGSLLLIAVMGALGLGGALVYALPDRIARPVITGVMWTLAVGTLSEVLLNVLRPLTSTATLRTYFGAKGITPPTAGWLFLIITAGTAWWHLQGRDLYHDNVEKVPIVHHRKVRVGIRVAQFIVLLLLPLILGTYLTEVLDNIGLFILMGLGLNIVVGFAGLLDLGYVAFFAIGAYMMGILTSQGAFGITNLTFWTALPICIAASVLAGIILGTPVLRMRGDYLAIVTLGFGEIIRVLATSDLLKPYIGGAQGILQIPKPYVAGFRMVQPQHFYYLILAGCLLAAFVAWRLRDSRLGRRWMAMREDEDVAEAMGIHLVSTKLLAFAIGAAFSGLAGAIFAARLSSIFPHSFNLLISINVLSLIIVGGIGSLPGVIVGAFVLVGLPELLREFAEYRLLMYGALLIVMMVARPEGLWPSEIQRRELHADEVPLGERDIVPDAPYVEEPVPVELK